MMERTKALCLVLILIAATLAGQVWGDKALVFLAHVAVTLVLEVVVSWLVRASSTSAHE